ncbi:MAG: hypothetical protein KH352_03610, partial [Ruminococcus sp.]|nr:hypothetical protein [Candidatus Apopatosoma intestinale]
MVSFIYGRSGSGKSELLFDIAEKSAQSGRHAYFLVPDREAVNAERTAAKRNLGANLDIITFTRLCDFVFRRYGGICKTYIENGAKRILMRRALTSLSPALSVYGGISDSDTNAVNELVKLRSDMMRGKVTPQALMAASEKLAENTRLCGKLSDRLCRLCGKDRKCGRRHQQRNRQDDADQPKKRTVALHGFLLILLCASAQVAYTVGVRILMTAALCRAKVAEAVGIHRCVQAVQCIVAGKCAVRVTEEDIGIRHRRRHAMVYIDVDHRLRERLGAAAQVKLQFRHRRIETDDVSHQHHIGHIVHILRRSIQRGDVEALDRDLAVHNNRRFGALRDVPFSAGIRGEEEDLQRIVRVCFAESNRCLSVVGIGIHVPAADKPVVAGTNRDIRVHLIFRRSDEAADHIHFDAVAGREAVLGRDHGIVAH